MKIHLYPHLSTGENIRPVAQNDNNRRERLEEIDSHAIIRFLKENPNLIHEIDPAFVSYFPPMGAFRMYLFAETYLLYEDEKIIFSSKCWAIVHRNQKEWHYYRERERRENTHTKPDASLIAPD